MPKAEQQSGVTAELDDSKMIAQQLEGNDIA